MGNNLLLYSTELPGKEPWHVYLHGATLNHTAWLTAAKTAGYRSLLLDLRGHGKSPNFDQEYPLAPHTAYEDVEYALLKRFGGKKPPFVPVGHSWGGMIAQMIAANNKGVEQLVLVSTTTDFERSFNHGPLRKAIFQLRKPGLGLIETYQFFAHMFGEGEMIDFTDPRIASKHEELLPLLTDGTRRSGTFAQMLLSHKGIVGWDVSNYTNQITVPTTIIHGTRDWLVPPRAAEDIKNTIQLGLFGQIRSDAPPITIHYIDGEHCLTHKVETAQTIGEIIRDIPKRRNGKKYNSHEKTNVKNYMYDAQAL